MLERQSLLFSHKLFFVLPLESRRRAAQQPTKTAMRFPTEEQGNHFRAGPALDPGPSCSHQVKSKSGNNVLKVWLLWEERDPFNSIFHPVSGQTLVLGLSKIITMRSLNAGKSSRLVVTVEPCLGTQHLHLRRNFQRHFMGRNDAGNVRLLIQIYMQPASLSVCWKWLQMLHETWQSKFVPRLLEKNTGRYPILQQTTIGDVFHDCLSSVRVTTACQPPESAWCFKDRVT